MKLIVASCGEYADTWDPFVLMIRHFWPDCPFPLVLLSDSGGSSLWDEQIIVSRMPWAKKIIAGVRDEFVLLMMPDHWVCGSPNTSRILECADFLDDHSRDVGCVRLSPCPECETITVNELGIGPTDRSHQYLVSTGPSIWKTSLLHAICRRVFTPHEFELEGSLYARSLREDHYAPQSTFLPFLNSAVSRGRWMASAVNEARKVGIEVDLTSRGVV